jgi:integrase
VRLPDGLAPHGLRHTYASILIALDKNPRYEMEQIGHTDPAFTLRLYTHSMEREDLGRGTPAGRSSPVGSGTRMAPGSGRET